MRFISKHNVVVPMLGYALGLALAGCQSYEPVPLDLRAASDAFALRARSFESVREFAQRLDDASDVAGHYAFNAADGLSPAEGEVVALFYNAELRLARLEAGVARADAANAGLWEDPVLGFDGADILSPSGSPFEWGLGLELTLPISGRLEIEKSRANAALEATLRELVDAEWRVRNEVRMQWNAWASSVAAEEVLASAQEQLAALDATLEKLETLGAVNRTERRLFALELAALDALRTEALLEVAEQRTSLLALLGLPHEAASLLLASACDTTDASFFEASDVVGHLIENNTQLAVRFAQYSVAEEALRLEIRKQFPDIVIGSGYATEFNDRRVMFGLSVPLPILNANKAGIARAYAQRALVREQAAMTFESISREFASAVEIHALASSQLKAFETSTIPLLEAQQQDITRLAALGEVDLLLVLQTATRERAARIQLLNLRLALARATIDAARLFGPQQPLEPAPVIPSTIEIGDA